MTTSSRKNTPSKIVSSNSITENEIEEIKLKIGFDLSNKRTRHDVRQKISRLRVAIARKLNKWDDNIIDKYAENWRPERKWRQKHGF